MVSPAISINIFSSYCFDVGLVQLTESDVTRFHSYYGAIPTSAILNAEITESGEVPDPREYFFAKAQYV